MLNERSTASKIPIETISKIQANFKKNAVVSLNEIGNAEYREFEFQVKKKSDFTIYSIGEGYDGEMFDY